MKFRALIAAVLAVAVLGFPATAATRVAGVGEHIARLLAGLVPDHQGPFACFTDFIPYHYAGANKDDQSHIVYILALGPNDRELLAEFPVIGSADGMPTTGDTAIRMYVADKNGAILRIYSGDQSTWPSPCAALLGN